MYEVISNFYFFRYMEEYQRFLQLDTAKKMVSKYKNVMDYLTAHTGKLINTTNTIGHLYNLLKEQVSKYSNNDKSKVFDFFFRHWNFHRITIYRLHKIWRCQDGLRMFFRVRWERW